MEWTHRSQILRHAILVVCLGALPTAGSGSLRVGPVERCEAGKGLEAGTYAACLHRAEGNLLRTKGTCSGASGTACFRPSHCPPGETCLKDIGPGSRYAVGIARCVTRLEKRWLNLSSRAAPMDCPPELEAQPVREAIDEHVATITNALAGHGLANPTADLAACEDAMASCSNVRQICETDRDRARNSLATCDNVAPECEAEPSPACAIPDNPVGILALPGDSRVELRWHPVNDAHGYRIERSDTPEGTFSVVGRTSGNAFVDATAQNDSAYTYRIVALGPGGASLASSSVLSTPMAPPEPPAYIEVLARDGEVALNWQPGAGSTEVRILRATSTDGPRTEIGGTSDSTWVDSQVSNGTT